MDKPTSRLPLKRKLPISNNEQSSSNKPHLNRPKNLRRSKSVTDLKLSKGLESTSVVTLGKRPAPVMKAPIVKPPKLVKANPKPEKENNSKPHPRIAPYDYKGRFNALSERFDKFKAAHLTCKDTQNSYEDLSKKYESLKDEFDEMKPKYELQYAELSKYKSDCKDLKKEVTSLKTKLQKSDNVVKYLQIQSEEQEIKIEKLNDTNQKFELRLEDMGNLIDKQRKRIEEADKERRVLHNLVQELKGNIRVFCRVRPPLSTEDQRLTLDVNYNSDKIEIRTPQTSSVNAKTNAPLVQEFSYDAVFPPRATQKEIFEDLDMLVQSALDGYHVCVFAYGQTGSGKTYTMQGNPSENDRGMIPRSVESLFKRISDLKIAGWTYEVEASFLEVYNEQIKDLLNPLSKLPHEIKYNEGKGVIVTNLEIKTVKSDSELQALISTADRNRAVAVTNYNEHSSRSHSVTKITLRGVGDNNTTILNGSINLVDLAGSENAKLSDTITETKHINKSLAALGNVMLALHNGNRHVPYRNSKLTYLLGSCLGGNSKTLMFLNIAPFQDCFSETINALRFAQQVKNVKMNFKKNKCML
ncbi:protein claret segregational [Onthophagus taurus]|uniref:protein claret segregational n=1 Tax=Onthophagus taurus TaxID=166361 RepID=UPI000C20767E|nr:protein claret segregational [Onthophagus taurus]